MRTAIAEELKDIDDFGERVYQAFSAPENTTTPYCTFKITGEDPVIDNRSASFLRLEVYLYGSPSSFTALDDLELAVRQQLHNATLQTDDSPPKDFTIHYDRTLPDFFDDQRKLFQKIIYFYIPKARAS